MCFFIHSVPSVLCSLLIHIILAQPSGSGEPIRAKRQHWAEGSHTPSGSIPRIIDTRPTKRHRNEDSEVGTNSTYHVEAL
ncbi:hypothetical protein B0J17DRAFT_650268 [Rhizoctonia solani]|nr:hypothetical protein B0J17DRAFT_650268 [Rhizoctonia solani]